MNINFVSWNVQGMGHPIKRGKVFAHLKSLSADIIFLQETHIRPNEQQRLRANWISRIHQATFSSKARGVAILFKKSISFHSHSVITDPAGRYIIVSGCINNFPITCVNVYGPNMDDPAFFRRLFGLIPETSTTNVIIAGDFNCYLDSYLDRSSSQVPPTIQSVGGLNALIKSMNFVDVWRLLNPTGRDYSFFSHVHKTYSPIDYFIIDSKLIQGVVHSKYHNILISDHSPVLLSLSLSLPKVQYCWRFNPHLLTDKQFSSFLIDRLSEFLETNDNGEVSDSCLWETWKVVMRGHIIAFESSRKKERRKRLSEIESILPSLEQVFRQSKAQSDLTAILKLKYEYNSILSDQVSNLLLKLKQKQFELSDKADSLLARQLKGAQASRAIHQIRVRNGDLVTHPKEINDCFAEFYRQLYSSNCSEMSEVGHSFLNKVNFPKISDSAKKELEEPFNLCEVLEAINSLAKGKATGPDGYGVEFYKANASVLAPLLIRMLNHSIELEKFPDSLYEAYVCLLRKKDRDDTVPTIYRPISLLNCDQKVIAKILTIRLNKHIDSIIHSDQTGFIPGRFSFCNLRRLLNILYNNQSKKI